MRQPKPLRTGDIIRLAAPGYSEPTGDCIVITDQQGVLVWFRSDEPTGQYRGPCFVARRTEVKMIQRRKIRPDGVRARAARTSHG